MPSSFLITCTAVLILKLLYGVASIWLKIAPYPDGRWKRAGIRLAL